MKLVHYNSTARIVQEARRDRAMFSVIEYFAKSLNVIQYNTLEKGLSPFVATANAHAN